MEIFDEHHPADVMYNWYNELEQNDECINDDYLVWMFQEERMPCELLRDMLANHMENSNQTF